MGQTQIAIGRDEAALIAHASEHLVQFYSDVDLSLLGGIVRLTSASRDPTELAALWQTAVANERLYDRAHKHRLELLAALT